MRQRRANLAAGLTVDMGQWHAKSRGVRGLSNIGADRSNDAALFRLSRKAMTGQPSQRVA